MTELEKYIAGYFGVSNEDVEIISTLFKPSILKKGDHFLKAGRQCDRLGFVQAGIVREYVVIDNKEVTKWISTPGYFVVDLSSFIFKKPARWNIHALVDTEMFIIEKNDYERILSLIPNWMELEKLFIAKCFGVLEDRILTFLSMTAEERYEQLFNYNSELFNNVPLQYLASMLGMAPETLSRLRKKR